MASDPVSLARRFEPILFFHPDEKFFPSDAKRYIEACALWRAQHPIDLKDSWGGQGSSFPRKPMIKHGNIAALKTEVLAGDTYLGDQVGSVFPYLLDDAAEERFLELKGWNALTLGDGDGSTLMTSHEPDVTATSENRYSNRDQLDQSYNTNDVPNLHNSRFWYHAELLDTAQLRTLMQSPGGPLDLSEVFKQLAAHNPALLCYYFFYPAHVEPLAPPCSSQASGQELACFAGEWASIALLLERDLPSQEYRPAWIGFTGRRDLHSGQALDSEERIGMSVREWGQTDVHARPLPELVGEHPKLFVSLGTHSFYLVAGAKEVTPYPPEEFPQWCGKFDTPQELDEQLKSSAPTPPNVGAALLKMLGGLRLGGIPCWVAGTVVAVIEDDFPGIDSVGSLVVEKVIPDETAMPDSAGKVVHPKGLSFPAGPGAELQPWESAENINISGREYNFIVDRQTQIWWPGYDLKTGYRGRWGPCVAQDPLQRRTGMRFPEFWRMFFEAFSRAASS